MAVVVEVRRDAPTRVAERAVVCSGIDGWTVFEELEIAFVGIYKIGVTGKTIRLRTAGTHFDGGIEGEAVMHIGVGTIDGKTIGVLAFVGVHENAVGNMRIIDIGRIDTAGVGAIIERAVVDFDGAGNR